MGLLRGIYSGIALFEEFLGILFLIGAIATRDWIAVEDTLYVGLFKTEYRGFVSDTTDFFERNGESAGFVNASIGLMFISLASLTATFVLTIILQKKISFYLLLAITLLAILPEILVIASMVLLIALIPEVGYDKDDDKVGFSFYLALFGGVFSWAALSSLGYSARRGELNEGTVQHVEFDKTSQAI
ncbi:uncharacterized protein LOC101858651 [Aplysia californica]|uniref:Uncharacterized protein LOC101858651 n=1 Tax=Aplysia californica TaxID=6500 RepID=A0ABM1A589_APLCA|nr:uncharacterized protein LOC101858651 [Aplysia californica]